MQTNPTFWRSFDPMLGQGVHFTDVAPNIVVKFPATRVGIAVMEEATYRGVSINATVSLSVAQAVAAAEAVERGLERRDREGCDGRHGSGDHDHGRPHRGLAARAGRARRDRRPSGGARVFGRRRLQARVSDLPGARLPGAAAGRGDPAPSALVGVRGGDVVITLPSAWQKKFNASRVKVRERMDDPVDPAYIDELRAAFPDFERAYEPDGLTVDDFDSFPPTVRTLRAFIASYHDLLAAVTDAQLPNPDVKA